MGGDTQGICPYCNGAGTEWILTYTLKERPHDDLERVVSAEFAASFCLDDYPDYDWAEIQNYPCDVCDGCGLLDEDSEEHIAQELAI